jgi:hypothetical protein
LSIQPNSVQLGIRTSFMLDNLCAQIKDEVGAATLIQANDTPLSNESKSRLVKVSVPQEGLKNDGVKQASKRTTSSGC